MVSPTLKNWAWVVLAIWIIPFYFRGFRIKGLDWCAKFPCNILILQNYSYIYFIVIIIYISFYILKIQIEIKISKITHLYRHWIVIWSFAFRGIFIDAGHFCSSVSIFGTPSKHCSFEFLGPQNYGVSFFLGFKLRPGSLIPQFYCWSRAIKSAKKWVRQAGRSVVQRCRKSGKFVVVSRKFMNESKMAAEAEKTWSH